MVLESLGVSSPSQKKTLMMKFVSFSQTHWIGMETGRGLMFRILARYLDMMYLAAHRHFLVQIHKKIRRLMNQNIPV
jgi:hypothetical protein